MNTDDELRRLAEAATSSMDNEPWWEAETLEDGSIIYAGDAAFIAAASPATVLALLDRIAELEGRLAAWNQGTASACARAMIKTADDLIAERDESREAVKRLAYAVDVMLEGERDCDVMAVGILADPIVRRIVEGG